MNNLPKIAGGSLPLLFSRYTPGLSFGWQSPDEGSRHIHPLAHGVQRNRWIHVDVAVHQATAHFHLPSARFGECLRLLLLTNAQQQSTF